MSSRWIVRAMLLSALLLPGCLQPKEVAGRQHPITLLSCQTAVPYLVVLEDWKGEQRRRLEGGLDASDAALMADREFLAPHRVDGGHVTPTVARKPAYPYIAVFEREGQAPLKFGPFTPPSRVEVCFPECDSRVASAVTPPGPEGGAPR